jgi:hypothetical protein
LKQVDGEPEEEDGEAVIETAEDEDAVESLRQDQ